MLQIHNVSCYQLGNSSTGYSGQHEQNYDIKVTVLLESIDPVSDITDYFISFEPFTTAAATAQSGIKLWNQFKIVTVMSHFIAQAHQDDQVMDE